MPYSEANSRLMLIDDRDPAVQYENSWDRETVFGNSISTSSTSNASVSMEFDGTCSYTRVGQNRTSRCIQGHG